MGKAPSPGKYHGKVHFPGVQSVQSLRASTAASGAQWPGRLVQLPGELSSEMTNLRNRRKTMENGGLMGFNGDLPSGND